MNRLTLFGIFFLIILGGQSFAQPKLKIIPDQIKFTDIFNRLQNVYLINEGNQPLTIDSIGYRSSLFYMRYDNPYEYHIKLYPSDTLKMDCILSNYFIVTSADTSDIMYVYSTPDMESNKIKIRINFFNNNSGYGTISGQVTDSLYPLNKATVYFFYAGKYLLDSAVTDNKGYYKKSLPEGKYFAAAQKQGYYLSYYNNQFDPFQANSLYLEQGREKSLNLILHSKPETGYSVKGKVRDPKNQLGLSKAIVVVRRGTHNPDGGGTTNKESQQKNDENGIYTALVNRDGSYSIDNIASSGYYYVQAFSEFYLPGYFNDNNTTSVLWQKADSVNINAGLIDKNIYLARDSSFGAGVISGKVYFNPPFSEKPSDVVILAKSLNSNSFYTYTYGSSEGSYSITDLPYGTYQLIAQKIGYTDAKSGTIIIDQQNKVIQGINLSFKSPLANKGLLSEVQLFPNYPNPFNPETNIEFFLPSSGNITVDVLNVLGERVAEVYNGFINSGIHRFVFNGSRLSSGTYFVRLTTPRGILSRKVMLIK